MPRATVIITTKNRQDDLRTALQSVAAQSIPIETIVFDDGSTDGTSDMVRREFPQVRLEHDGKSRGLIVRRNELTQLAGTPIIFSIDDDAAFSTPDIVAQTLDDFDDPRIGAVGIPFINVRQDEVVRQRASSETEIQVLSTYIGTAHAIRRDVFLNVGGYRGQLVHQGEEGDYCIRMLDAGYVVRAGRADPIHHFESPRRSFERMDLYGRRNDILFAWHNCPIRYLPGRLIAATLGGIACGFRVGRPWRMLQGLLWGYYSCGARFDERAPVSAEAFRLYRRLAKNGQTPLAEIETRLPQPRAIAGHPSVTRPNAETLLQSTSGLTP